jgi:hypothetical protein
MKTFFSGALLACTAFCFSSCQLIPDEFLDIFKPDPKPSNQICELIELTHESDTPEGSFAIRFDSTGENNDEVVITTTSVNGDIVDEIKPDYNVPNMKFMYRRSPTGNNWKREVLKDSQGRLISVRTDYGGNNLVDIESITHLYTYNGNKVEAKTTTRFREKETTVTTTTFEYVNGNLTKISSDEGVVNFQYGNMNNKLFDFQKAYTGFGIFSPIEEYLTLGAMVPIPSQKLPIMQNVEGELSSSLKYNWTLDSNRYPSKVEVVNSSNKSRIYEYTYDNCKLIQ